MPSLRPKKQNPANEMAAELARLQAEQQQQDNALEESGRDPFAERLQSMIPINKATAVAQADGPLAGLAQFLSGGTNRAPGMRGMAPLRPTGDPLDALTRFLSKIAPKQPLTPPSGGTPLEQLPKTTDVDESASSRNMDVFPPVIPREMPQVPFAPGGPQITPINHEQSNTIQNFDNQNYGGWMNVFGQNTPNAGGQLPGSPVYPSAGSAVQAAKQRSQSSTEPSSPLEMQRFWERSYAPPVRPLQDGLEWQNQPGSFLNLLKGWGM